MELRQLVYFLAVAEELHFTRAAAKVHVVQSSLSASVGALERELGDALFVRDSRRVTLTPAGRTLLPAARRAVSAAEEARDAVAGLRGAVRGTLHIGAIQTLGVLDLPALLATFHHLHPEVSMRLRHDAAGELARAAADGMLDVAFIDGPIDHRRLDRTELGSDRLVLAVNATDPLGRRTRIRLDDRGLRERDFVDYRADSALRAQIDAACAAAGLARSTVCEAESMFYLVELVRQGMGIAIVPPGAIHTAPGQIRAISIEPALTREMCAVVASHRPPSGPARALLDLLGPAKSQRGRRPIATSSGDHTSEPTTGRRIGGSGRRRSDR